MSTPPLRPRRLVARISQHLWYKTAVPIFIERYLLPLLATVTFALIVLNPMKFDRTQQITLGIAVLAFAYFLAHTLHQSNLTSKQSIPTADSQIPPPVTTPSLEDRSAPDLVVAIDQVVSLTSDFKVAAVKPGREVELPRIPEGKDTYLIVAGSIKNRGAVASIADDWALTFKGGDGRTVGAEMLTPSFPDTVVINRPKVGDQLTVRMSDYWPRKMDMSAIPANGISYGFVYGVLWGVSPSEYSQPGSTITLNIRDIRGKVSSNTIRYEDRPPNSKPQQ